ncbi:MAG: DUF4234 domain-containing protein [Clostridia bacterium]|nr:DUF4234 domain-containing protein [Clostridia bacterium]
MAKKRSVGLAILFSIITCGIYGLYWFVCLTNDSNKLSRIKTAGGVKALLLTIVTLGIYQFYWFYMLGKKIEAYDNSSSGVVHLLLGLFGLGIISYAMAQSTVNRWVDEKKAEAKAEA